MGVLQALFQIYGFLVLCSIFITQGLSTGEMAQMGKHCYARVNVELSSDAQTPHTR